MRARRQQCQHQYPPHRRRIHRQRHTTRRIFRQDSPSPYRLGQQRVRAFASISLETGATPITSKSAPDHRMALKAAGHDDRRFNPDEICPQADASPSQQRKNTRLYINASRRTASSRRIQATTRARLQFPASPLTRRSGAAACCANQPLTGLRKFSPVLAYCTSATERCAPPTIRVARSRSYNSYLIHVQAK